jgi:uncharacterized protein YndB with AHSA1/START domain
METTTAPRPTIDIRVARVIGARPGEIYSAWTTAATKPTWWGKTERAELTTCEMDVRVGGRFRYEMRLPKTETPQVAAGEHLEINPPHRLIFTWPGRPDGSDEGQTTVTFELFDLSDGTTRGVVTHQGITDQRVATAYRAAWANLLQDLAKHFTGTT